MILYIINLSSLKQIEAIMTKYTYIKKNKFEIERALIFYNNTQYSKNRIGIIIDVIC